MSPGVSVLEISFVGVFIRRWDASPYVLGQDGALNAKFTLPGAGLGLGT